MGSLGTAPRSPWSMWEGTRTLQDDWATATSCDCEFMSLNADGRSGSVILDCSSAFLHAPLPSVEDRPQGPSDINSQSQLVAVAQSSRSVLVPSCMLHGDREPVPSDPVDIEFQNLNSCTELPEEMTSIFNQSAFILDFDPPMTERAPGLAATRRFALWRS